jgi:aspartate racemase
MKTIGLIGGMSWESSLEYYKIINETVRDRLGGLHSAKCILYSVEFSEIEELQRKGMWLEAGKILSNIGHSLEIAGADILIICTNTMHKVAVDVERVTKIPLLHIADPTAETIKKLGLKTIGLLGTRFTMEDDFYRGRLKDMHGLSVLIPEPADRQIVHRIIYDELCLGKILDSSRDEYKRIILDMIHHGAEGIILGCTEIGLLISAGDCPVPVFDTTLLHAARAVDLALTDNIG